MGVGNLRWQYPRLTRSNARCPVYRSSRDRPRLRAIATTATDQNRVAPRLKHAEGGGAMGVGDLRWQYPRLTRSNARCPVSRSSRERPRRRAIATTATDQKSSGAQAILPFCGDRSRSDQSQAASLSLAPRSRSSLYSSLYFSFPPTNPEGS